MNTVTYKKMRHSVIFLTCLALLLGTQSVYGDIVIPDYIKNSPKGFAVNAAVQVLTKTVIGARAWALAHGDGTTNGPFYDGGVFHLVADIDASAPHFMMVVYFIWSQTLMLRLLMHMSVPSPQLAMSGILFWFLLLLGTAHMACQPHT